MSFVLCPRGVPLTKRLFDLLISLFLLVILSPVLIVLVVLEIIYHGFPVFFRQQRPGYRGEPFVLYKFRTMTRERGNSGLLPDEHRITRFGRLLRSTSMDELPELFNVIKGEMSLVGPRPLLMKYLELYSTEQARRHAVLPGITGWAQVNGRNAISWEQKFELDVWYVDHWSFGLDLRILWLTAGKVFRREDINQPGHISSEEFTGSADPEID